MAGSVNKAIILGNLGADPEVKYLPSGQAVCELRVATSYDFQDKSGQAQQRTEWHRVAVWGKVAENCGKYLKKGQQVYVEGRIQTRSWEDKEGKKQYMTEVVADQVVFLSKAGSSGGAPSGDDMGEGRTRPASTSGGRTTGGESTFPEEDDIPF